MTPQRFVEPLSSFVILSYRYKGFLLTEIVSNTQTSRFSTSLICLTVYVIFIISLTVVEPIEVLQLWRP